MVVAFQLIGWYALVSFAQGQDILRELSFTSDEYDLKVHAWLLWLAVCWWSWQSFRTSRILLHLSYFNFWHYEPAYALRAQVQVPRILAVIPYFIVSWAIFNAKGIVDAQIVLYLSTALWMYVFLHFRKDIIVWIRAKKFPFHHLIPDYIPIKNGTYPVKFILQKQAIWFYFRLIMIFITFFVIVAFPITIATYTGAAAIILWGCGTWLVVASVLQFIEKWLKIPVALTLVICVVAFSFVNNNHRIRTSGKPVSDRKSLESYFIAWVKSHPAYQDKQKIKVYLFASQGGGLRAAYWMSGLLAEAQQQDSTFRDNVFCLSGVSGGTLGVSVAGKLFEKQNETEFRKKASRVLSRDFLSPISAWLVYTDMLQKFIPLPIYAFDRARVLEYSWERSWQKDGSVNGDFSKGFVSQFNRHPHMPMYLFNATHAENGSRILISNVKTDSSVFHDSQDLFDVIQKDIPLSTAVSISSRFPFLTPPARIFNPKNQLFGNVVDGGYFENSGATTILELYIKLREIAYSQGFNIDFKVVLVKNAMSHERKDPIRGMAEFLSPVTAFANVWYKSGSFGVISGERFLMRGNDKMVTVSLNRTTDENIPLGWYLSQRARNVIDNQVNKSVSKILN